MGKPIDDPNRISPEEAARRLGMSRDTFCQCLIHGKFPARYTPGIAIKKEGHKNYTFIVYRNKVTELEQFWGLTS